MSEPSSAPRTKPNPSPEDESSCLKCGARNEAGAVECWLCNGRALVKAGPDGRPPEPSGPSGRFPSTIAGKTMLYLAFCAVVGLSHMPPGYLILLAVIVLPALALVEVKAARRRRRGMPMAGAERSVFFLLYLILVPVLLIGAGLVALFIFCSVTGGPNFH